MAMRAATDAAMRVIATSKNPGTVLGRMRPRGVAFHAAYAVVEAYRAAVEGDMIDMAGGK